MQGGILSHALLLPTSLYPCRDKSIEGDKGRSANHNRTLFGFLLSNVGFYAQISQIKQDLLTFSLEKEKVSKKKPKPCLFPILRNSNYQKEKVSKKKPKPCLFPILRNSNYQKEKVSKKKPKLCLFPILRNNDHQKEKVSKKKPKPCIFPILRNSNYQKLFSIIVIQFLRK